MMRCGQARGRAALSVALCVLALSGVASAEETVLETVHLRNRPAEELVPLLETVLGSSGAVTTFDNRLIIRAPRSLLPSVHKLIAEFDVRASSLWISVRQGQDSQAQRRSAGGSIVVGSEGVSASGQLAERSQSERARETQRLRVLEGAPAFISAGSAVPQQVAGIAPTPTGPTIVAGTTYQQARRGFWVVARLAGERVILEIETALDQARPGGGVDVKGVSTTVTGKLGEWIDLGGIAQQASSESSGILLAGESRRSEAWNVQVKVDHSGE